MAPLTPIIAPRLLALAAGLRHNAVIGQPGLCFSAHDHKFGINHLAHWGSAVIAPALELEQYGPGDGFPWLRELDGCLAVARWAQEPTWFASVHTQASPVPPEILDLHRWDEVPLCSPGGMVWQMNLIPFEFHRLFADQTFVWSGDLNSATRMDDVRGFPVGTAVCARFGRRLDRLIYACASFPRSVSARPPTRASWQRREGDPGLPTRDSRRHRGRRFRPSWRRRRWRLPTSSVARRRSAHGYFPA